MAMTMATPVRRADGGGTRLDTSPSRYVVRFDPVTGGELPGSILPEDLLVSSHRDRHPVDIAVQFLAGRIVRLTGSEWVAQEGIRALGRLRGGSADTFRFRDGAAPSADEARARVSALRRDARAALDALGPRPSLRILLTGATGFLGKEILAQAMADPHVTEVVCLLHRDPAGGSHHGSGRRVDHPGERGPRLLRQLGIRGAAARRIRFLEGDVERPRLGLPAAEAARLRRTLTHVVHCAASVAFDQSYDSLFRANVVGSRNALGLSLDLQRAPRSPFVAHVAVETSYIHGRLGFDVAREDRLAFPEHFYNNFYELTKAMAAIETERALLEQGLRVVELLPSIVIGNSRTGNNRGDTKVVNAPVNAIGRVKRALEAPASAWHERLRTAFVGVIGSRFPADPSAELNLITVDRVAAGVLAALTAPQAVGARIHLATDQRIRSEQMVEVIRDELEVDVRMADPMLTRTLTMPLARAVLGALGEDRLASGLERLRALFSAYVEWGQPVHGVGRDVDLLALPARRPDTIEAFRMLCRHSRFVQEFGAVRDPDEIARRERLWERAIDEIEFENGRAVASLPAREFRRVIEARISFPRFRERAGGLGPSGR
jgi:nucleoside-diphosphate-sugar epimerase